MHGRPRGFKDKLKDPKAQESYKKKVEWRACSVVLVVLTEIPVILPDITVFLRVGRSLQCCYHQLLSVGLFVRLLIASGRWNDLFFKKIQDRRACSHGTLPHAVSSTGSHMLPHAALHLMEVKVMHFRALLQFYHMH